MRLGLLFAHYNDMNYYPVYRLRRSDRTFTRVGTVAAHACSRPGKLILSLRSLVEKLFPGNAGDVILVGPTPLKAAAGPSEECGTFVAALSGVRTTE